VAGGKGGVVTQLEPKSGIYIASKSKHAPQWRALRDSGVPIISTWIDEAGEGETLDWTALWKRCIHEAWWANTPSSSTGRTARRCAAPTSSSGRQWRAACRASGLDRRTERHQEQKHRQGPPSPAVALEIAISWVPRSEEAR